MKVCLDATKGRADKNACAVRPRAAPPDRSFLTEIGIAGRAFLRSRAQVRILFGMKEKKISGRRQNRLYSDVSFE